MEFKVNATCYLVSNDRETKAADMNDFCVQLFDCKMLRLLGLKFKDTNEEHS